MVGRMRRGAWGKLLGGVCCHVTGRERGADHADGGRAPGAHRGVRSWNCHGGSCRGNERQPLGVRPRDRPDGHQSVGLGYFETTPEDVVVLRLDGSVVEGSRRPSEAPLHAEVYRRRLEPAPWCTRTHPMRPRSPRLASPSVQCTSLIADSGAEEVPLSSYVTSHPELAASVGATFGEHPETNAVLMENHGLVACGPSMAAAFGLAINLEFMSRVQWQAECVGTPRVLGRGGHGRFETLRDVRAACRRQGIGLDSWWLAWPQKSRGRRCPQRRNV